MGKRKGKRPQHTLRLILEFAFVGIALVTSVPLALATYFSIRSSVSSEMKQWLRDSAGLASLHIDTDLHSRISQSSSAETDAHHQIQKQLRDIQTQCGKNCRVYTLRGEPQKGITVVVSAGGVPAWIGEGGDIGGDEASVLLRALSEPHVMGVTEAFSQWGDKWLSCFMPLFTQDGVFEAVLGMDVSASRLGHYQHVHMQTVLVVSGLLWCLAVFLAVLFSQRISNPLRALQRGLARLQVLDLEGEIKVDTSITEVTLMKQAVEGLRKGLRSFRKYVPADLVADLIKRGEEATLGVEKRVLTVMFSDIAGFTSISESVSPDALSEELSLHFHYMTETIMKNSGTLDKYMGDGLMAFWGAPVALEDHAVMACRAALQCQKYQYGLSREWVRQGRGELRTRIGINTGEVLVGNIGYEERLNYTALGDGVNLASRLEGLNRHYGTDVLVGESTYRAVESEFEVRLIDVVKVKGMAKGVPVYELVGEQGTLGSEWTEFFELYTEAMAYYMDREWSKAEEVFGNTLMRNPQDIPSRILFNRCRSYVRNPPGNDWQGAAIVEEEHCGMPA